VEFYHPLFAYESILSLLNLVLILWVSRRFVERLRTGDLFLLYLFNASIIRFLLEFLRLDVAFVNGLNINQLFMFILAVCCTAWFYLRNRTVQGL
jgi:phosphatidylglycerol:prolipoprotein diacylglycerol transferase